MAAIRFLLPVVLVTALVSACSDDNDNVASDVVANTQDEGFARGNAVADQAAAELTPIQDPAIVLGMTASILRAINDGEIIQATFAVQVVAEIDVANFAQEMIDDHTSANASLDDVVRQLGIAFLPSGTADTLALEASAGLADLRATPPGQIDFVYIQLQVINHGEAQVLLDELATQVGPGPMGDYIAQFRPMIINHFDQASALLSDMVFR